MRLPFFNAQPIVSLVLLVLLLAASLLWAWHIGAMQEDEAMTNCLLGGGRVMLCALSTAGQIGLWQEMFAAVLPLGTLFLLAFARWRHHGKPSSRGLLQALPPRSSWLFARVLDWMPFEPLRRAFSRGILHPKIYESA